MDFYQLFVVVLIVINVLHIFNVIVECREVFVDSKLEIKLIADIKHVATFIITGLLVYLLVWVI